MSYHILVQNQELLRRRRSESEQTSETIIKEREKHLRDIDLKEVSLWSLKVTISRVTIFLPILPVIFLRTTQIFN